MGVKGLTNFAALPSLNLPLQFLKHYMTLSVGALSGQVDANVSKGLMIFCVSYTFLFFFLFRVHQTLMLLRRKMSWNVLPSLTVKISKLTAEHNKNCF